MRYQADWPSSALSWLKEKHGESHQHSKTNKTHHSVKLSVHLKLWSAKICWNHSTNRHPKWTDSPRSSCYSSSWRTSSSRQKYKVIQLKDKGDKNKRPTLVWGQLPCDVSLVYSSPESSKELDTYNVLKAKRFRTAFTWRYTMIGKEKGSQNGLNRDDLRNAILNCKACCVVKNFFREFHILNTKRRNSLHHCFLAPSIAQCFLANIATAKAYRNLEAAPFIDRSKIAILESNIEGW